MAHHEKSQPPKTLGHHVHETAPLHDPVDPWHDHSRDERPQEAHTEVQNTGLIMGVGVALFFVVVASSVVVYGFYIHYTTQRLAALERTTPGAPALVTRREAAMSLHTLNAGGRLIVKQPEGPDRTVRIVPVEQSSAGVVAEYAGAARR